MDMKKTALATAAGFVLQMGTNYFAARGDPDEFLRSHRRFVARRPSDGTSQVDPVRWLSIFVLGAVLIYQRGAERKSPLGQGIRYGILLARMVSIAPASLFEYVTTPIPHRLAAHWIIGEGVQCAAWTADRIYLPAERFGSIKVLPACRWFPKKINANYTSGFINTSQLRAGVFDLQLSAFNLRLFLHSAPNVERLNYRLNTHPFVPHGHVTKIHPSFPSVLSWSSDCATMSLYCTGV